MRAVIQRVSSATLTVDKKEIANIGRGLVVLLGWKATDTSKDIEYIKNKLLKLRIFHDEQNKMNKSVVDVDGEILLVSQFTLYGDCSKGNRPSFTQAMPPEQAEQTYNEFVRDFKQVYPKTQTGIFGAYMQVQLVNDGPVTIILDSEGK